MSVKRCTRNINNKAVRGMCDVKDKCVICKAPLKQGDSDVCFSCNSKYHIDEEKPIQRVRKMRKER